MKFDPIDSIAEIGSSLLGRVLLFFSSGWVGVSLGRIAGGFDDWNDFFHSKEVILQAFEFEFEPTLFILWPLWLPIAYGHLACVLMPFFCLLFFIAFYHFVYDDEPLIVWWLAMVFATTLIPLSEDDDALSWAAMGGIWVLLIIFSWWSIRRWDPEFGERVAWLIRPEEEEPPELQLPERPKRSLKEAFAKAAEKGQTRRKE